MTSEATYRIVKKALLCCSRKTLRMWAAILHNYPYFLPWRFSFFFASKFSSEFLLKWPLKIAPHLKVVADIPRETIIIKSFFSLASKTNIYDLRLQRLTSVCHIWVFDNWSVFAKLYRLYFCVYLGLHLYCCCIAVGLTSAMWFTVFMYFTFYNDTNYENEWVTHERCQTAFRGSWDAQSTYNFYQELDTGTLYVICTVTQACTRQFSQLVDSKLQRNRGRCRTKLLSFPGLSIDGVGEDTLIKNTGYASGWRFQTVSLHCHYNRCLLFLLVFSITTEKRVDVFSWNTSMGSALWQYTIETNRVDFLLACVYLSDCSMLYGPSCLK